MDKTLTTQLLELARECAILKHHMRSARATFEKAMLSVAIDRKTREEARFLTLDVSQLGSDLTTPGVPISATIPWCQGFSVLNSHGRKIEEN